ncbi:MAG: murein DD-endopeptidase MepM/ murein hydrolase activator NlpD [Parvicella sp.]
MSKKKYKYDPKTLSYNEVELTWRDHLRKVSYHLMSALLVSFLILFFSYSWIKRQGIKEANKSNAYQGEKTLVELQNYKDRLAILEEFATELQLRDDNVYRVIFGADPYNPSKREMGTGGNPMKYKYLEGLEHGEIAKDIAKKVEALEQKLVAQSLSFDSVINMAKNKEALLLSIPSIQPISNTDLTRIASGFGYRMHPVYKIQKMHAGIDFTADSGTEIFATGDGVVYKAEVMSGYGNIVIIDHGFGYKTRYAHCSAFKCNPGQKVKRGEVIALVGNTGISTGPHVHYEVHYKGQAVNPVSYFFNDLSAEEYDEVVKIASRPTQSM